MKTQRGQVSPDVLRREKRMEKPFNIGAHFDLPIMEFEEELKATLEQIQMLRADPVFLVVESADEEFSNKCTDLYVEVQRIRRGCQEYLEGLDWERNEKTGRWIAPWENPECLESDRKLNEKIKKDFPELAKKQAEVS